MLCLPAKTTSNKVDWASSLSKYVARAYSKAQAEAHKEQFRRVDELRRQVAAASEARLEERTAADARALYVRYYKLLCSMEQRFEVAELRLTFPWRDAFQPGMRQGEADLRFERAAVLFNVASAVTFEAASQNRRSAEGIRRACKLFQEAAGVLHAVAALVGEAAWGASASVDLAPRTLATLASLMLAQAQRCFYEKAEQDAMSPKLLSKIAAQVALLYADNMTDSMAKAIEETERRRTIQQTYNEKHGVVPTAAGKKASNSILSFLELSRKLKQDGPDADLVQVAGKAARALEEDPDAGMALEALPELIDQLEAKMKEAAKKLDFEDAANLRDRIKQLRQKMAG